MAEDKNNPNKSYKARLFLTKKQEEMLKVNFEFAKAAYNFARGKNLAEFIQKDEVKCKYKEDLKAQGIEGEELTKLLKAWDKENYNKYITDNATLVKLFNARRDENPYYIELMSKKGALKAVGGYIIYDNYKRGLKRFLTNLSTSIARVNRKRKKNPKKIFKFPQDYGFPKYKTSIDSIMYAINTNNIDYERNRVFFSKEIGYLKVSKNQPLPSIDCLERKKQKYIRIFYDGKNYYIVIPYYEKFQPIEKPKTDVIGIDMGLTEMAVLSNGWHIPNVTKTDKYIKLSNQIKKLNKKKCWLVEHSPNSYNIENKKEKWKAAQSRQMKKLERMILNKQIKMNDYKNNYMNEWAEKIAQLNPKGIIFEDLAVHEMFQNKHTSSALQQTGMATFKSVIIWHATKHLIPVKEADRWEATNQTCSCCGEVNPIMKTGKRILKCRKCGEVLEKTVNTAELLRDMYDSIPTYSNAEQIGLTA